MDESDGSFLLFTPNISVITNIDYEHIDYYHTWENILQAYAQFIAQTKPSGTLVACAEDERLNNALKSFSGKIIRYGWQPTFDLWADQVMTAGFSTAFDCRLGLKNLGRVELKVPGRHNVLNALACCAVGIELGLAFKDIKKALGNFTGVKRRFELKGQPRDVWIVDDYGHHPQEIIATLKAAKSFNRRRLWTIFQPHRFTRTKFLWNDFAKAFADCDELIVTDIYAASEASIPGITADNLVKAIQQQRSLPTRYWPKDQIIRHLVTELKPGDLVLTLGAGDITKLSDNLVQTMEQPQGMKT